MYNFKNAEAEDDFIEDNGDWHLAKFDSRTGLYYYADRTVAKKPAAQKGATVSTAVAGQSDEMKAARKLSSSRGLKALTGSKKQKEWAETIRAKIVEELTDDEVKFFTREAMLTSRFWIDNRTQSAGSFALMIKNYRATESEMRDIWENEATPSTDNPQNMRLRGDASSRYENLKRKIKSIESVWKF